MPRPRSRSGPLPSAKPAAADRNYVTALARGLEVLGCFRRGEGLLGNQEIAARCGLPKSTVSRLTHTLTDLGYLHHVPELGRYRLGTAVLALGSAMLGGLDVRRLARPLMQQMAAETRTVIGLGMRDRRSVVYLELARGDSAISLNLEVGSRISLTSSAMGRAWWAACDPEERERMMDRLRGPDEEAWQKLRRGVGRAVAEHREFGCCCSFGDWQPDVNAIALGFQPGGGMPPMVVNCGAPSFVVSPEDLLREARPRLAALVARLDHSMDLSGNG
jgi:DNA-binding IclR family transcriptional regulator